MRRLELPQRRTCGAAPVLPMRDGRYRYWLRRQCRWFDIPF